MKVTTFKKYVPYTKSKYSVPTMTISPKGYLALNKLALELIPELEDKIDLYLVEDEGSDHYGIGISKGDGLSLIRTKASKGKLISCRGFLNSYKDRLKLEKTLHVECSWDIKNKMLVGWLSK